MRDIRILFLLLALPLLGACASARMRDDEVDRLFRSSKYADAAEILKSRIQAGGPGAPGSNDELLYLLDAGLALHQAGEAEASNAFFSLAEKHVSLNGYASVSEEAGTLLTSENTKVYRGEDFERVLIHVYKALNYAMLGGLESALVEARLVNRRLEEMKREGEKPYKQNAFARYLAAILYEAEGEFNDAYVDYKKVHELEPAFQPVGRDLWRMAAALGMRDEMDRWKSVFQLSDEDAQRRTNSPLGRKSGRGEIIVIFQNGISPVKRPDPAFPSLPDFVPRYNPVREAEVSLDGVVVGRTVVLHDIEATAISNLGERKLAMAAKRVAGRVTKAIVADQIRRKTKNEALAFLTEVALIVSDQADTRSWSLLPRDLQISRISVDAGVHELRVEPIGGGAAETRSVQVDAGKKVFLSFRYLP
jgi:hypothetical protein